MSSVGYDLDTYFKYSVHFNGAEMGQSNWEKYLGYSILTNWLCPLFCAGRQCSPRGGDLEVLVRGDGRVDLTGKAVTVMRGTITV